MIIDISIILFLLKWHSRSYYLALNKRTTGQTGKKVAVILQHSKAVTIPHLNDHLDPIAVLAKSLADGNRLRILVCVINGKKLVS